MNTAHKVAPAPVTIALVDGSAGGHHIMWLRKLTRDLLDAGHTVLAIVREFPPVLTRLREECPQHLGRIHWFPYDDEREIVSPVWRLRGLYVPLEKWRRAARAVRAARRATGLKPDLVFFCWLDVYLLGMGRLSAALLPFVFPYRWSGLYFHPWHLRTTGGPGRDVLRATEHALRSWRCRAVAVLDEGIAAGLEANVGRPVIVFPDDTDATLPAGRDPLVERIRAAAGGRKIVGLIGALEKRKGVLRLIEIAERSADRDWFFVFVGEWSEKTRKTFEPHEAARVEETARRGLPNAFFHFAFLPGERQFNAVVDACDVLFAAYAPFYHSSGILTKAACFEKPVLVGRGHCMHERVERFSMGLSVNPYDREEIVSALECLLDERAFRARVGTAPDFAGYRTAHSRANLPVALANVVRRRL